MTVYEKIIWHLKSIDYLKYQVIRKDKNYSYLIRLGKLKIYFSQEIYTLSWPGVQIKNNIFNDKTFINYLFQVIHRIESLKIRNVLLDNIKSMSSEEYKKFINLGQNFPFLFRTEILEYIATDEFKNETEIIQDDPISDKYGYGHAFEMIEKKYKLINDELYMRSLKKEINDDIHYIY